MKYSHKLSDAIHILAYLVIYQDADLSSKAIAASIESNASVVRNLMSDLRKAGLITTQPGSATTTLSVEPSKITIFDVFRAINMDHDLLHVDPKTNPQCIVGGNIQDALNIYYDDIQQAAFHRMKEITIQNITDDILSRHRAK
ncbi:Rrf2 family transcriptional regulator [Paucilactobacillus kaifaensis]|uniref:Rrf2 family transcriptional regulator n=1 Tax=Paucilactobacillus kaifaensis TaxID=2559921 RepID=UPI0010F604B3|nr:Rrf2 family transcriptional regulator [Paucilactobacillus kaifaensis]